MTNENYDELVKQARRLDKEAHDNAPIALVNELRNAVEQLQKDNDEFREAEIFATPRELVQARNQVNEARAKLARAERRIADLREGLRYYERAESVTFPAKKSGPWCYHRNVAKEILACDEAAAAKETK